ncbi:hypothetical protein CEXT_654031 [Caerostris extrusa]|uniref:Uncharacterized protein n=1 Tax=Caerostris extrusa TaxID=172846 RepID=A0AAV4SMU8_CAEEX|nr:hypothetical protein CEXT_654031 [Caerostris extrusa]
MNVSCSEFPDELMSAFEGHARSNSAREHDDGPKVSPQRNGRRDLSGAGSVATSWDPSWHCCTPTSHPNASGGDAGLSSDVHPNLDMFISKDVKRDMFITNDS